MHRNDSFHRVAVEEGVQGLVAWCLGRPGDLLEWIKEEQWGPGGERNPAHRQLLWKTQPTSDWSLEESTTMVGGAS